MILVKGRLDYSVKPDVNNMHIFTGNAFVKNNGALVMGRGAAQQVRDLYPTVQFELGNKIKALNIAGEDYLVLLSVTAGHPIWVFQVKYNWFEDADVELIKRSVCKLHAIAENNPDVIYHMNYPGIGNGKLSITKVEPALHTLPDNVIIYK